MTGGDEWVTRCVQQVSSRKSASQNDNVYLQQQQPRTLGHRRESVRQRETDRQTARERESETKARRLGTRQRERCSDGGDDSSTSCTRDGAEQREEAEQGTRATPVESLSLSLPVTLSHSPAAETLY